MAKSQYHLERQEIPDGFQIFEERLEVNGVQYRKKDAAAFAKTGKGWLELEPEPDNTYDSNAVKVLGCWKGLFGIKRRHIGYVPKETAEKLAKDQFINRVRPRLLKTYIGDGGFIDIEFQILGPKGEQFAFRGTEYQEGAHYTDNVDYVKRLKSEKRHQEAIKILYDLIKQSEAEAQKAGMGVAPWYYEQLAIILRKEKRYEEEIAVLERYERQPKAPGVKPQKLAERLEKLRNEKGTS